MDEDADFNVKLLSNISEEPMKKMDFRSSKLEQETDKLRMLLPNLEVSMEEEVRQAEMESRLRRMITEVLKPSIVKVTLLQTDHEIMTQRFQEMIDGHQQVLSAQKEAKEHSQVIDVFRSKLTEFWEFSNGLEDKINASEKASIVRMEELEHACELNKSNSSRLGRNLDRALQDMDKINTSIKVMQASLEKGVQKNKERIDTEIKTMHTLLGEVRDLHHKLEIDVWGAEDCSDISPPSLRKLDMCVRKQTGLLAELLDDISALQKLEGGLTDVTQRQGVSDKEIEALQVTAKDLGEAVEVCASEAKADFKQASNLMAAFSANLVREARHSFKDELKHAQQMQKEVDDFVKQTQSSIVESDAFVKSLSKQLEAMVREVRYDLDNYDGKRHRDKQQIEEQLHALQSRVVCAVDSSQSVLKGLEHISGVISMSLQSERMSVALDLQDFVERKDTPYIGIRESAVETTRLRQMRSEKGLRQPGVDVDALHRMPYTPLSVEYQGTAFERPQLLALREKLVHVAQEVLQQGPDVKRRAGADMLADLHSVPAPRIGTPGSRSSTPARPGSRGQPGARGSPLLEGHLEGGVTRELRHSPDMDRGYAQSSQLDSKQLEASLHAAAGMDIDRLPVLSAPARRRAETTPAALTAR